MILNPDWLKPKEKPYFHQISLDCIENYSGMFGYINTGNLNIRIHRNIEGKMWFGVGPM
jgi:hypothetical protein